MRSIAAFALFALSLLPATAFAQTGQQVVGQQAAAQPSLSAPTPARRRAPASSPQYIHRAERAGEERRAQFRSMDANRQWVVDPPKAGWRSQHSRAVRISAELAAAIICLPLGRIAVG
jgi:hypothetical protein